jgi:hypothetical protein
VFDYPDPVKKPPGDWEADLWRNDRYPIKSCFLTCPLKRRLAANRTLENRESNWDPAWLQELGSLSNQLALGMTGRAAYPRLFCVLSVSHGQTPFFTLSNMLNCEAFRGMTLLSPKPRRRTAWTVGSGKQKALQLPSC